MLTATFEPVTNREDWTDLVEVRDIDNALYDLTGATIVVSVADGDDRALLTASTDNGAITIQGLGLFEFMFTKAQTRGLETAHTYKVGCTIEINSITRQLFIGTVAVLHGVTP